MGLLEQSHFQTRAQARLAECGLAYWRVPIHKPGAGCSFEFGLPRGFHAAPGQEIHVHIPHTPANQLVLRSLEVCEWGFSYFLSPKVLSAVGRLVLETKMGFTQYKGETH